VIAPPEFLTWLRKRTTDRAFAPGWDAREWL
jgi:hypothetical protein